MAPETFEQPQKNRHTPEQLAVMRCRHVYRVDRVTYERVGATPPSQPGARPSLVLQCTVCGVSRIHYPGERMQAGETLVLTRGGPAVYGQVVEEPEGQIVDESEAPSDAVEVELPVRRRGDRPA